MTFHRSRSLHKRLDSLLQAWERSWTTWNTRLGWAGSNQSRVYLRDELLRQCRPIFVLSLPPPPEFSWSTPTHGANFQRPDYGTLRCRSGFAFSCCENHCCDGGRPCGRSRPRDSLLYAARRWVMGWLLVLQISIIRNLHSKRWHNHCALHSGNPSGPTTAQHAIKHTNQTFFTPFHRLQLVDIRSIIQRLLESLSGCCSYSYL